MDQEGGMDGTVGFPSRKPRLVLRSPHAWIASAVFTVSTALTLPSAAQAQQQQQGNQQPIKNEQLTRIIQVAAVTVCNLSRAKVPFDTAVGATSNAVASLIAQVHGGKLEGLPQALPPQQIFEGVSTNVAIQSYQICKDLVPAESAKKIDQIIKSQQSTSKK